MNWRNKRTLMKSKTLSERWKEFEALPFFNQVMDLFFKLLILFVVLVLGMGLFRLFWEVWKVIISGSDLNAAFSFTITSLLTFFIILELFKSLVEYFREHRLKLTFIVDATLVFLLREVMIGLYQHQSSPLQVAAFAFLALALGIVRTLAIIYSPMERKMVEHIHQSSDPIEKKLRETSEGQPASASEAVPVQQS